MSVADTIQLDIPLSHVPLNASHIDASRRADTQTRGSRISCVSVADTIQLDIPLSHA